MYPQFLRIRTKHDWRKTAVLIHTVAIIAMFLYMCWAWNNPSYAHAAVGWWVFLIVDCPLGLAALLLAHGADLMDVAIPAFVDSVVGPAVVLGLLGGLQWYWIVGWITRQDEPELRKCEGCGYDLRGSLESGCCPECGSAFDEERTRNALKQDARLQQGGGRSE